MSNYACVLLMCVFVYVYTLFPMITSSPPLYSQSQYYVTTLRTLGGIFYDDFDTLSTGLSQEQLFKFVTSLGDHFPASYFPLIKAGAAKPYTEEQKRFQQLRRGRYVEFNVMYDRGMLY